MIKIIKILKLIKLLFNKFNLVKKKLIGDGDWGLGIGDWAQSPIPNPHNLKLNYIYINNINLINLYN